MAIGLVLLVIVGCILYNVLRTNLVGSFCLVIISIISSAAAFGYYEILANLIIARAANRFGFLVSWAHPICMALIFALCFAILQLIMTHLSKKTAQFGKVPEQIGSSVCGIFMGLIISGFALNVLFLCPISTKYPYQRVTANSSSLDKPSKVLLNVDGLVTGLVSNLSGGSFSPFTAKDFGLLHNDFISQSYINRIGIKDDIASVTITPPIVISAEDSFWLAPEGIKDSSGGSVTGNGSLMVARIGFKKSDKGSSSFIASHIRIICKPKSSGTDLKGDGINVYPVGYMQNTLQLKRLNATEKVILEINDFRDKLQGGMGTNFDMVFDVPSDYEPVAVAYKQNTILELPKPSQEGPSSRLFIVSSELGKEVSEIELVPSVKLFATEISCGEKLMSGCSLTTVTTKNFQEKESEDSPLRTQFVNKKIVLAKTRLETTERINTSSNFGTNSNFSVLLKSLSGYKIVALKCNTPNVNESLSSSDWPTLIDINKNEHKAVGVFASAQLGSRAIYEIDFSSVTDEENPDHLVLNSAGVVEKAFPDSVWITDYEGVDELSEFFVLYMVKPTTIISVKYPDSSSRAGVKDFQGFLVK